MRQSDNAFLVGFIVLLLGASMLISAGIIRGKELATV